MAKIALYFVTGFELTLLETHFEHPISGALHCVRGKSCGAYNGYGSFPWTAAVSAMSLLLAESAACKPGEALPQLAGYSNALESLHPPRLDLISVQANRGPDWRQNFLHLL